MEYILTYSGHPGLHAQFLLLCSLDIYLSHFFAFSVHMYKV